MLASVFLYLVLVLAYVAIRPPLSYHENGTLKTFGVGKGHTLFPLWVVAVLAAVMVAFVYAYVTV